MRELIAVGDEGEQAAIIDHWLYLRVQMGGTGSIARPDGPWFREGVFTDEHRLNPRQRKFAELIANGWSIPAAYHEAGYRAKSRYFLAATAGTLVKKPKVRAYVRELRAAAADPDFDPDEETRLPSSEGSLSSVTAQWIEDSAAAARQRQAATMAIREKREFLARIVRTPIGDVDAQSDLCLEFQRLRNASGSGESDVPWDVERIVMPSKLEAIRIDAILAGEMPVLRGPDAQVPSRPVISIEFLQEIQAARRAMWAGSAVESPLAEKSAAPAETLVAPVSETDGKPCSSARIKRRKDNRPRKGVSVGAFSLRPRRKKFAELLAQGWAASAAYVEAGYRFHRQCALQSNATALAKDAKVRAYVRMLRAAAGEQDLSGGGEERRAAVRVQRSARERATGTESGTGSSRSPIMSLREKREFLARVIRTPIGALDDRSDLTQSVLRKRQGHGAGDQDSDWVCEVVRMPQKLKALRLDAMLAGEIPGEFTLPAPRVPRLGT